MQRTRRLPKHGAPPNSHKNQITLDRNTRHADGLTVLDDLLEALRLVAFMGHQHIRKFVMDLVTSDTMQASNEQPPLPTEVEDPTAYSDFDRTNSARPDSEGKASILHTSKHKTPSMFVLIISCCVIITI